MKKTLSTYLQEQNIHLEICPTDPILMLPVSLFESEDATDLIILLWLYGKNWLDFNISPEKELSVPGKDIIANMHESLYNRIQTLSRRQQPIVLSMPEEVRGLTKTQVSLYYKKDTLFKTVQKHMHCEEEIELFLNWFNSTSNDGPSLLEMNKLYDKHRRLSKEGTLASLLSTINIRTANSEPFKDNPYASRLICEKQRRLSTLKTTYLVPNRLDIFTIILNGLADRFPISLDLLLAILGVDIPPQLNKELVDLLLIDLKKVPNYELSKSPRLVYYFMFFIFNHAQATKELVNFSCGNKKEGKELATIAKKHTNEIQTILNAPIAEIHYFGANPSNLLVRELTEAQLDSISKKRLALLCFDACPLLRDLFIIVWKAQAVALIKPSVILMPHNNPFIIGSYLSKKDSAGPIAGSYEDNCAIYELMQLAKASNKDPLFFQNALSVEQFNTIKARIKPGDLRESITLSTIESFTWNPVLNKSRIAGLIFNNKRKPKKILQEMLGYLFMIDNAELQLLILDTKFQSYFIDWNDPDTVPVQIAKFDKLLAKFTTSLENPDTQKNKHYVAWFNLMIKIYSQYRELLIEQLPQKYVEERSRPP